MATTNPEVQIQWTGPADTDSVASGGQEESLEVTPDQTTWEIVVSFKADRAGTASDANVDVFLLVSSGDPDGAGADEFDTDEHAIWLANVDCAAGSDPAQETFELPFVPYKYKILVVNNGATDAITVSCTSREKRA